MALLPLQALHPCRFGQILSLRRWRQDFDRACVLNCGGCVSFNAAQARTTRSTDISRRRRRVQAAPGLSVSSCQFVTILCSRVCDYSDIMAVLRGANSGLRCCTLTCACPLSSLFGPANPLFPFLRHVLTRFHTTPLIVTRPP